MTYQFLHCPHCGGSLDTPKIIEWGGWSFDENKGKFVDGTPASGIKFSKQQSVILSSILRWKGNTVSRQTLYSAICGNRNEKEWPEIQIVNVHILHIRSKLVEYRYLIETRWGEGVYAVPWKENNA